ncbi:ECF transporter S component [Clostridiaceae bacterium]|nr:ECF transporter S component [Clostridiaceae bacterium]NBI82897.1 ECF transporter S component [Clostridiaceae bacterium]
MKPHYLNKSTQNLALSAMFIAIGIVLPFFTGQLQQIGNMLLPMHLPVLLCGLICGWQYGAAVGFILPPLRYVMFAAPPIFPIGAAMAVELAAYGLIAGFLYNRSRWQCIISLYRSLIAAMIGGRLVWGIARVLMTGVSGEAFTWQMFLSGALLTAIPGIMIQLVFIPAVMVALDRTGMVHFRRESHHAVTES